MSIGVGEVLEVFEVQVIFFVVAKRCRWRGSMVLGRRRLCVWSWGFVRGQWGEGGGRVDIRGFVDFQVFVRGQLLGWVGYRQGFRISCQRLEELYFLYKGSSLVFRQECYSCVQNTVLYGGSFVVFYLYVFQVEFFKIN